MKHFHSPGVPHAVAMIPESSIFESPKSLIMILLSSSGLWYKRFSGLRSRCTTPELWRIKETTIKNCHSLFRKKRFMLDEKFQQNASKLATFYVYENTQSCFFHFSFCATLFFPLMNAASGLCWHRPGHSLGKKIKLHEMKNEKTMWVFLW